jgi:hypothetical protein
MAQDWVVYSKPCLQADHVIEYLARYTHRTAISDGRLLGLADDRVNLRYKDYRDGRWKVMALDAEVLIQRFLLHILPRGLVRIRHYGFLANACRAKKLPRLRQAIAETRQAMPEAGEPEPDTAKAGESWCLPCPRCQRPMRVVAQLPAPWQRRESG